MTDPRGTKVERHVVPARRAKPAPPVDRPGSLLPSDPREASLAAAHELSERLTAVTDYLAAALRCWELNLSVVPAQPWHVGILEQAAAQAALANAALEWLRRTLRAGPTGFPGSLAIPDQDGTPPAQIESGPAYRVSFINQFARNSAVVKACQRTIVIRSARTCERAIEAAQKRFARLEGIGNWRLHAQIFEVDIIAAGLLPAEC